MERQTSYWTIRTLDQESEQAIQQAAALWKEQELIAFPTETVYGLGADATKEGAVAKIFEAKGRPADNPLIVHVADVNQIADYVKQVPPIAQKLMDAFMPGPITLILRSNDKLARNVTAGLDTIGIRVPDHPIARELLRAANLPIAAPSANTSGKPSPTSAIHVYHDLYGKIAGIVDGGLTGVGVESTVVDCTGNIPVILRPGGITQEEIEKITGVLTIGSTMEKQVEKPKAPGMKYNHYEPDVPLWLVEGDEAFFQTEINRLSKEGLKVGVMASEELLAKLHVANPKSCGSLEDLTTIAVHLYDTLRSFKAEEIDIILSETFPKEGIGQAVMNRLEKAASATTKSSC
ncbi:threonylcarbamoyl-AMP synthase [Paraliobacillus ryukyuensis]|uniref:Threonylcarbamoyl-AMP synthase n=1 Tax=Paraliobacillus ryukyuensis TaxID=200904 RepID=A0A366EDZ2_9BACI|nr:L-threonylcarbamoyladenylate synthase [Paraliobacillus ryukyuensis]RBP00533.1 translation factor SUA5 [Paraliobacillus ryukyuensis]